VNPCGFPLLPAFLSFYLGTDERRLPAAPTRAIQGLFVGALVTAGFLGLFAVVGLPVSFGVGAVTRSVPGTGLATGVVLVLAGLLTIIGVRLRLPRQLQIRATRERSIGAMLMFGVGYGAASLGCTLPLLLTLVGASLGGAKVAVFVAYGVGMGVVLMALSVLIALLREGAARALHPALPYMNRLGGRDPAHAVRRIPGLLLGTLSLRRQRDPRRRPGRELRDPLLGPDQDLRGRAWIHHRRGRGSDRHLRGADRTLAVATTRIDPGSGGTMTRALAAALALVLALAAGCGSSSSRSGRSQLADLRGIDQLKALFNAHTGEPRLVILVSPT
jgi:cytochrome c biogenesis protein CcdA